MTDRALVLDCDGVLAETEKDGHLVAFNRAFEQLGLPFRWSAEEYGPMLRIGGGKERMRAYFEAHPESRPAGRDDLDEFVREAHKLKSQIYVELVESGSLPPRPGIPRVIGEALDAGWQVACASTSAAASVEAVLKSVLGEQQRARMTAVFAGDIVKAKKPAPDIYLMTAEELGRKPSEIVVIEDSQVGAAAAAAAQMTHVVTVSYYAADDSFPEAASVVDSLGDPGAPVGLRAGIDVRNSQGFVDLDGLETALRQRAA